MGNIKRSSHGPEWHIQQDLIRFLRDRQWNVEHTHGNKFQTGFPDLYIAHPRWGQRWIDCKQPERYTFTKAQRHKWPLWDRFGIGIWILTAANQEQYDLLFGPPNWRQFAKKSWGIPSASDIDKLLDGLQTDAEQELLPEES